MKKLMLAATVLLIVSCQEQAKIGYVDNVKLMEDYQEKKDFDDRFKVKDEALTKKRDSISQAYQFEVQAFQIKAQKMAPAKAQEEYGAIQQRAQQMGQLLQQEDQVLRANAQVELDSIVSSVKSEIKDYGKTKAYTYILGGGEGGSVLYGEDGNNLTDEIVKILNNKYTKE